MVLEDIKNQLREIINDENDSEKLKEVLALLSDPGEYKRLTTMEYSREIDEARQQIKDGDSISQDDLEKESEDW